MKPMEDLFGKLPEKKIKNMADLLRFLVRRTKAKWVVVPEKGKYKNPWRFR